MDTIKITDNINEMIEIGRTIETSNPQIYTAMGGVFVMPLNIIFPILAKNN